MWLLVDAAIFIVGAVGMHYGNTKHAIRLVGRRCGWTKADIEAYIQACEDKPYL